MPGTFEIKLPRSPEAARRARTWMAGLDIPLSADRMHDLILLANELVTNAVVHAEGKGKVALRISVQGDAVRVEVSDPGEGIAGPRVKNPRPLDTSGRGLGMVGEVANRWGWRTENLTNVWFEFDRREPANR
ncbi:MAG TPA: ATP-binding protein [Actinomycetota bacterium]|nr:ATP-binding protein [Actinomycetota bacterium]